VQEIHTKKDPRSSVEYVRRAKKNDNGYQDFELGLARFWHEPVAVEKLHLHPGPAAHLEVQQLHHCDPRHTRLYPAIAHCSSQHIFKMSMFRSKKLDLGCFVNIKVIRDHTKRKVFAEHEPERYDILGLVHPSSTFFACGKAASCSLSPRILADSLQSTGKPFDTSSAT
jgi:hypothetical protein